MALFRSIGARPDATRGTTAEEVRKDLAGLFTGPGVLPGSSSPLVVGTASMAYQVNAGTWVTTRGAGDGVHLWGNDGAITVDTSVAPGSGLSRIDIIYALHPSADENADTDSVPVLGVAQGTAASSPVAPTIPTGALELARNTMTSAATDTAGSGNTITQSAAVAYPVGVPDLRDLLPAGGTIDVVLNASGAGSVTLHFPAGKFAVPPALVVSVNTGVGGQSNVTVRTSGITKSAALVVVNNGEASSTVPVNWIATVAS